MVLQLGCNKPTDLAWVFNVILMYYALKEANLCLVRRFSSFLYHLRPNSDLLSSGYLLIKITSLKIVLCVA
jgi:hypothetical protein